MSEKIKHSGIIESLGDHRIHVRIQQSSACAACKVSAHCNSADTKDKIVDVYSDRTDEYRVGESVVVAEDNRVGLKAALYAYVVPLCLMIGTLVLMLAVTGQEAVAALAAFLILIPYYAVLYLLRNKIRNQINFDIEKIYN